MGCGKVRFGRMGQKTPKIENFGLKVCSLGSQSDPHVRARGNPNGARGNPRLELEASCDESSRQPVIETETSFTTPHYYPKYEVWAIENFVVRSL